MYVRACVSAFLSSSLELVCIILWMPCVSSLRASWNLSRFMQMVEVIAVLVFITTIAFLIPITLARCDPNPKDPVRSVAHRGRVVAIAYRSSLLEPIPTLSQSNTLIPNLVRFFCKEGEYSLLASLFLSPAEVGTSS